LANASAVIFYPSSASSLANDRIIKSPWFEGDPFVIIPVLTVTHSVGTSLLDYEGQIYIKTNTTILEWETKNLWCDTKEGDKNLTIVIGAHLDSVNAGPGINDNGSGSSTVLELLHQWYASGIKAKNRVRFAWWGAEEEGLLGSRNYIRYLQQTYPYELNNIALALNLDMVGSPNYWPMIGRYTTLPNLSLEGKNGSEVITSLFEQFFNINLKK